MSTLFGGLAEPSIPLQPRGKILSSSKVPPTLRYSSVTIEPCLWESKPGVVESWAVAGVAHIVMQHNAATTNFVLFIIIPLFFK